MSYNPTKSAAALTFVATVHRRRSFELESGAFHQAFLAALEIAAI
jgi:hypothetical protein